MFKKEKYATNSVVSSNKQRKNFSQITCRPNFRPNSNKKLNSYKFIKKKLPSSFSSPSSSSSPLSSSPENELMDTSYLESSMNTELVKLKKKTIKEKSLSKINSLLPSEDILRSFRIVYKCSWCHYVAYQLSSYNSHIDLKHKSRPKPNPFYQCRDKNCELLCDSEKRALDHLKRVHNVELDLEQNIGEIYGEESLSLLPTTVKINKDETLFRQMFLESDKSPPSLTKINAEENIPIPKRSDPIPTTSSTYKEGKTFNFPLSLSPVEQEQIMDDSYPFRLDSVMNDAKLEHEVPDLMSDDSISSNESPNLVIDLSPKKETVDNLKEKSLPSILTFSNKLSNSDFNNTHNSTAFPSDRSNENVCGRYKISSESSVALWWDKIGAAVVNHRRKLSNEKSIKADNTHIVGKISCQKIKKRVPKKPGSTATSELKSTNIIVAQIKPPFQSSSSITTSSLSPLSLTIPSLSTSSSSAKHASSTSSLIASPAPSLVLKSSTPVASSLSNVPTPNKIMDKKDKTRNIINCTPIFASKKQNI